MGACCAPRPSGSTPGLQVGLGKTLEAGILAYPRRGASHERLMGLGLMTPREDAEPVWCCLVGRSGATCVRQACAGCPSWGTTCPTRRRTTRSSTAHWWRCVRAGSSRPMVEHGLIERLLDRMRPFIYVCFELTGDFLRVTLPVKFWRPEWKASSGCWKYCDR